MLLWCTDKTHMHMLSYLVPPLLSFAPRWKAKNPTGEIRPCLGVFLPVPPPSTFLCRLFSPHSHLPAITAVFYHQLPASIPAGSHYNINALSSIVYRHYLPVSIRFASSRHGVFSILQSGWLSVFSRWLTLSPHVGDSFAESVRACTDACLGMLDLKVVCLT